MLFFFLIVSSCKLKSEAPISVVWAPVRMFDLVICLETPSTTWNLTQVPMTEHSYSVPLGKNMRHYCLDRQHCYGVVLESQSIDRSNRWINAIAPTPQSEVQILHRSSKEETMPNLIANYSTRRKGARAIDQSNYKQVRNTTNHARR